MEKIKKKRITNVFLIIVIVGVVGYLLLNIIPEKKMSAEAKYKKVLVMGIDGMDYKITKSLLAAGKLPNFQRLADNGSFLQFNTSTPPESPVAWTSIATGVNPGKHNLFDFIRRDPQLQLPELSLSKSTHGIGGTKYESYVKAVPFWRIASEAGVDATVIRWPVTFPPEKVSGKMFSGLGVPDLRGFLSGYTVYTMKDITNEKDKSKIVEVTINNGVIETLISGPKMKKGSEIIPVTVPMKISVKNDAAEVDIVEIDAAEVDMVEIDAVKIDVNGKSYTVNVNEWSDWISVSFKIGLFKKVSGIFKVHLTSIDPFEMYITSIQIDPRRPIVDISYPDSYSAELANDLGLYYTLGMPEETDGYIDGKLDRNAFLQQVAQVKEERKKMFWKGFNEFKEKNNGLFAFVFDTSDRLQHTFWNEKVLTKDDRKLSINRVVLDYYIEKDELLGDVMNQLGNDTLLIIVSDHGFTSFEREVSLNNWLVENGFMDLTKSLDKREESPLFQYVDWSGTKAYALGFASIYVNVKGREGKGIVEDREKVVSEIVQKLGSLTDPKTGKEVIHKAYRKEEIYNGDFLDDAPDIVVGFNPGYRMSWQTAVGGFGQEVFTDNVNVWNGDHLVDPLFVPGVLFSNKKLDAESASLIDVAPTVIDALGMPAVDNIDGKSLLE